MLGKKQPNMDASIHNRLGHKGHRIEYLSQGQTSPFCDISFFVFSELFAESRGIGSAISWLFTYL